MPPRILKKPQLKVRIIHLLHHTGPSSISDIVKDLKANFPSIKDALYQLSHDGMIYKLRPGILGHKQSLYDIAPFPPSIRTAEPGAE